MLTTINPARRRRRIALLLGAVGAGSLPAAALPELTAAGEAAVAAAASPATVKIDNFAFAPATLTVTAGTTVTWKNEDDSPHRIGDKNGTFKSRGAADLDPPSFDHTDLPQAALIQTWSGNEPWTREMADLSFARAMAVGDTARRNRCVPILVTPAPMFGTNPEAEAHRRRHRTAPPF
jgi:plastocyanin